MKKSQNNLTDAEILRQKAEEQLKEQQYIVSSLSSENDLRKLTHELQVHQIEVEMQYERLKQAKEESDAATQKYAELYNFAPSGYFTLTKLGEIIELNLHGARLLGKERLRLINRRFGSSVSDQTKSIFNTFLDKVFTSKGNQSCEVTLSVENKNIPTYVYLTGHALENGEQCLISVVDITELKKAEEALKASETKYHAIFDNVQDVFYQTDLSGTVLEVSPSIENILGFSRDEIIGKPIAKLSFDFKSRDMFFYKLKENGELRDYELRLKTKTREFKYTSINARLIFDADGKPNHIDGAIRDITQRKLDQVELQASKEFLKNIINAVASPVFVKDDNYKYVLANNALCSLLKIPIEKIIGSTDSEYFPEEQLKVFIEKDSEVLKTGKENINEEYFTDGTGKVRTIVSQKTLYTDTAGNKFLVGVINDITERKWAEESLVKLKTAIEKSEASVVITDRNGNIEYANPFFTKITGYSPDEYLEKNSRVLKSAYHPKEFYEDMWNTIISGNTWEGEFYNCKKNGEFYWENAIISPIENSNKEITHFVAIKTDITESKKIKEELINAKEHAEESDRLKSAFLTNMSHEIRTPMNGILGFAELLKEPNLSTDEQNSFIEIIGKSGQRMLNTINCIIDISKIESGLVKVNIKEANINEKMEFTYRFFKPEVESKGIQFFLKYGLPDKEAYINTDNEKVYGILTNLVKNAIKFTHKGSIELGYEKKGKFLEFHLKDTGIGIPKDRLDAIFERFIKADIEDKQAFQGSGLGLTISKSYVEMLGGKMWIESEEGLGSTFYFTIPYIAVSEEKTEIKSTINAEHNESQLRNLKILIVEDDEISYSFLSLSLDKIGGEILHAITGVEAVEACRNNPDIDLVLMDIRMPKMDGNEATCQIRQFNKDVIIIAQTAYAFTGDSEKAIEAGC